MTLSYDLTLVNGNPESAHHRHYFEYHFSYDTQVRSNEQRRHLKSAIEIWVRFVYQILFHFLGFAKSIFTFTRSIYYTYPSSIFRGCETKTPNSKAAYSRINFGICGHSADIISLWLICTKWSRNQSIQCSWWCYGDFCTGTILFLIQSLEYVYEMARQILIQLLYVWFIVRIYVAVDLTIYGMGSYKTRTNLQDSLILIVVFVYDRALPIIYMEKGETRKMRYDIKLSTIFYLIQTPLWKLFVS